MKTIEVEIKRNVFNTKFLSYLDCMARTQIFYGGSSSGKSVFLAQRSIYDLIRGGRNYLVTRQVGRTIRGSVFAETVRVIREWGLQSLFNINKSEMLITCNNDYQIIFAGLDDVEKLKSLVPAKGAITDVWIEEATEIDRNSMKHLYKRQRGGSGDIPKRISMSFNPILRTHWIFTDYFAKIGWTDDQKEYQNNDLAILKTWYQDNRFLTDDDRRDLENEDDKYFYDVYTLGNWGVLGNVIFTNWKVQDLSKTHDQFVNLRNGLDFGFAGNPAALSRSHYDRNHKTIYIFDELYEHGLTNDVLAEHLKPKIGYWRINEKTEELECYGTDVLICDSAEPKSIAELQNEGINAIGATKGKDSITHGIQWLQQHVIIIDANCINAQNEFRQYHWKEDKDGNALSQPVDKNNHFIDATRYAYESDCNEDWYIS